jgi:hypothetical protein
MAGRSGVSSNERVKGCQAAFTESGLELNARSGRSVDLADEAISALRAVTDQVGSSGQGDSRHSTMSRFNFLGYRSRPTLFMNLSITAMASPRYLLDGEVCTLTISRSGLARVSSIVVFERSASAKQSPK